MTKRFVFAATMLFAACGGEPLPPVPQDAVVVASAPVDGTDATHDCADTVAVVCDDHGRTIALRECSAPCGEGKSPDGCMACRITIHGRVVISCIREACTP